MKRLLDHFRPVWNADDGAGAGGDAGGGSLPAGGAAAADKGGSNGAAAAADAGAERQQSGPYRPDGMHEQYHGKDDRETIDKLHKAVDGYRQRDSSRDVPDKPEGYLSLDGLKDFKLDDAVKPYFENLTNDPAAKAMFDAAKAHGMDRGAVLDVWQKGMQAMAAAGILEPLVDPAAERAKLLPDAAKGQPEALQDAAIDARMQQNEDFITLLTQQKGPDGKTPVLDPDVGKHALLMLMDTAAGNQFLEFVRGQMQGGGKAQPLGGEGSGGQGGGDQRAQLAARAALPENTIGNPKFSRASWDALQADYRKLIGD